MLKHLDNYNFIIIGAGIVGLATALNLLQADSKLKILILEKENRLGVHQTGNNSGVIHSGIYYKPGSAKSENCKRGYNLLIDFCNSNQIHFDICGKLIIATDSSEEERLHQLYNRGLENGLKDIKILNGDEIKVQEPYVNGKKAILVPSTGIIDFKEVLEKYAEVVEFYDCKINFCSEVTDIIEKTDTVVVETNDNNYCSDYVISCSGLQSDRVARKSNSNLDLRIIPFRGEYFKLKNDKRFLVNNLIYPVPDPSFPFLGVHFTKKNNGEIEAGPNAVLSFKREGYTKYSFDSKDAWETFTWPGFQKVMLKYWKTGMGEFYRSFNKNAFASALQKLIPSISKEDLEPGGSGVRAQACDINGNLLDDFNFHKTKRVLHVCNAPSPAATASLAIGEKISKMFLN
jgi:(S)-2-hydroxyglutarate dehydrogenase